MSKLAYTVAEAASMLSLSRSRMYELIHCGLIESVKFGRSRRITEEQMLRFLHEHEVESSRAPPFFERQQ